MRRKRFLKNRKGYIIPATKREDAEGVDFWVKLPGETRVIPVQVTQRGVAHFRRHHSPHGPKIGDFMSVSEERLREKRRLCRQNNIAFVLVRDFEGCVPDRSIAWGDVKALRHAIAQL